MLGVRSEVTRGCTLVEDGGNHRIRALSHLCKSATSVPFRSVVATRLSMQPERGSATKPKPVEY
jgi:hypothetical protein